MRMAFEAGRGGSGLEPKLAVLRLTPAEIRRTPPPDPPGPRTDPGRTRHRTIRTRGTGGAHPIGTGFADQSALLLAVRGTPMMCVSLPPGRHSYLSMKAC